jgi:hypothetical protein
VVLINRSHRAQGGVCTLSFDEADCATLGILAQYVGVVVSYSAHSSSLLRRNEALRRLTNSAVRIMTADRIAPLLEALMLTVHSLVPSDEVSLFVSTGGTSESMTSMLVRYACTSASGAPIHKSMARRGGIVSQVLRTGEAFQLHVDDEASNGVETPDDPANAEAPHTEPSASEAQRAQRCGARRHTIASFVPISGGGGAFAEARSIEALVPRLGAAVRSPAPAVPLKAAATAGMGGAAVLCAPVCDTNGDVFGALQLKATCAVMGRRDFAEVRRHVSSRVWIQVDCALRWRRRTIGLHCRWWPPCTGDVTPIMMDACGTEQGPLSGLQDVVEIAVLLGKIGGIAITEHAALECSPHASPVLNPPPCPLSHPLSRSCCAALQRKLGRHGSSLGARSTSPASPARRCSICAMATCGTRTAEPECAPAHSRAHPRTPSSVCSAFLLRLRPSESWRPQAHSRSALAFTPSLR